ncbi:MAG: right-handed parallel beta-helix repeat-containing protein [Acidobacteria bacterium]|nr:right-handed parallel beta-helix repeat-containing protein [Acidobacteriota bacterium]MBI3487887.1 right-handed parallel beta-helix repeat-containing protein [Acidobacteriota bacterium]
MDTRNIRVWLVGVLAAGSMGLLFTLGRGSSRAQGDAQAVAAVVPPVPAPLSCLPPPASPRVFNVREAPFGAKGDGLSDDTAALQRAVDAAGGTGGTVLIPDGTYLVNAAVQGNLGLRLKSRMTLRLSPGAVLKAIPNGLAHSAILAIHRAEHVNVVGGTLQGERGAHQGQGGEWGMGLSIAKAQHVVVEGVTARDCWGDGFYVSEGSADVTLCNVVADRNRRQGLSITSADGVAVRNSTFKNTSGTEPEAGIDVEPNDGETVRNVLITGCTLAGNAGGGFQCGFNSRFTTPRILNLVFDRNVVTGNGLDPAGGGFRSAVKVSHCIGDARITNNTISMNMGQGIMLMEYSAGTTVTGNTITGTAMFNGNDTWSGGGIYVSQCPGSVVRSNTVNGNAGVGIWLVDKDPSVDISGNTVTGNGGPGIRHAVAASEAVNKANAVSGNGKRP